MAVELGSIVALRRVGRTLIEQALRDALQAVQARSSRGMDGQYWPVQCIQVQLCSPHLPRCRAACKATD